MPVLLVPGAYENADYAWANPSSGPLGCGASSCPTTGLMQSLTDGGYRVFGITFPHTVGNNYNHAEQIGDAIQIIKASTGAAQVDVVAWSMGVLSSRMYASSVTQDWGTAYGEDIRKLILVGGPNNGLDYAFRHGIWPATTTYTECGGSVIGGTAAIWQNCFGWLFTHPELTLYVTPSGDFFPGIRQMLKRWDATYPLNPINLDVYTTYYGGIRFYGTSYGIDFAISQGSLIAPMRNSTVPAAISTYLLCGSKPNIPNWNNETDGPSDGSILLASCKDEGAIGTVAGTTTLNLNHMRLTWDSAAKSQITTWLG